MTKDKTKTRFRVRFRARYNLARTIERLSRWRQFWSRYGRHCKPAASQQQTLSVPRRVAPENVSGQRVGPGCDWEFREHSPCFADGHSDKPMQLISETTKAQAVEGGKKKE
jgi:hypothetical protein